MIKLGKDLWNIYSKKLIENHDNYYPMRISLKFI